MSFFRFLLLLSLSIQCSISEDVIHVTEENELEQFLCYNDLPVGGNTTVVLSTNITHQISGNVSFCMINTTYSLYITSNSSGSATINCNAHLHIKFTTGFSFNKVHNLTLQRLVFRGCGGFLKNSSIIDVVNSLVSPFHFTRYQSAVLVFPQINILLLENVTITSYYGFAILAINPVNATMNSLTISVSKQFFNCNITYHEYIGSGALIVFTQDHNITGTHTVINNSLITENLESLKSSEYLEYPRYVHNYYPILSAAGLTVFYTQTNYPATVSVLKTNFTGNYGVLLFLLHYNTSYGKTVFDKVSFIFNMATEKSNLLILIMIDVSKANSPLNLNHSMFHKNVLTPLESNPSSLVFISLHNPSFKSSVNIYFSNSVFSKTNATRAGSCIYAIDTGTQDSRYKVLKIYITNITAHNNFITNYYGNTKTEFMKTVNAKVLYINGFNTFSYNFGSVFDITNTIISLSGHLNIIGNNGYMGTGFKVKGPSLFLLCSGLNATFINNTALTIGGAIYAMADDDFTQCMFQNNTGNATNISMTFIDNTASEAGSSIYSNKLYVCDTYAMLDYKKVFSFSSQHRYISMPPSSICLCDVPCNANDARNEHNLGASIRPGQNIFN